MNLGKPRGVPSSHLAENEEVIGEFVVEMIASETEFDDAGNRFLRPVQGDAVRFAFSREGRTVPLFEMTMGEIRERMESGNLLALRPRYQPSEE